MDSEEDYMSGMSTDAEIMQEYSGDEMSAGEGTFAWNSCFFNRHNPVNCLLVAREPLEAYKSFSLRLRGRFR